MLFRFHHPLTAPLTRDGCLNATQENPDQWLKDFSIAVGRIPWQFFEFQLWIFGQRMSSHFSYPDPDCISYSASIFISENPHMQFPNRKGRGIKSSAFSISWPWNAELNCFLIQRNNHKRTSNRDSISFKSPLPVPNKLSISSYRWSLSQIVINSPLHNCLLKALLTFVSFSSSASYSPTHLVPTNKPKRRNLSQYYSCFSLIRINKSSKHSSPLSRPIPPSLYPVASFLNCRLANWPMVLLLSLLLHLRVPSE